MNDISAEKDFDYESSTSTTLSKPFTITITKLRNIITSLDHNRCYNEQNVDKELKYLIKFIRKRFIETKQNERFVYVVNKHHFYNDFVIK